MRTQTHTMPQPCRVIQTRALRDDWLDTLPGKARLDQQEAEAEMKWLASEAAADEERHCLTAWEGW